MREKLIKLIIIIIAGFAPQIAEVIAMLIGGSELFYALIIVSIAIYFITRSKSWVYFQV